MLGMDQLPQPPVYRVEADGKLFGDSATTMKFLNKIQKVNSPDYHPFADKLSPFEEWKHTLLTVMETVIQFFIHDICWNACYYTWRAIFYVLMLLPFAALGLIGVYAGKLKNKCCKRKEKAEKSPFSHFPKPATTPHNDTPALSNEDE
jgi:hypothetical protein